MADIRIKDLTTTASSTASGDFFVIDGTTGTRKVNAFNPSFGGNATVTGTLTVNGTANGIVANGAGISLNTDYSASVRFFDGATVKWWIYKLSSDENLYFRDMGNARMQLQMLPGATSSTAISTFNSRLEVTSTTASTTTSSGALVVSGGVGVAGAINAGSYLRSINSAAANDTEFTALRADVGADGTLGAAVVAIGSLPSATGASRYGFITCSDNIDWRKLYIGGRPGLASSGGQVLIPSTASSTSTSSGALVVSGGVGVGGAIYAGGDITAPTTANITGGRFTSVNSNSYIEQSGSDFNYVTASTRPHVFSIGGTTRFQVTTSGIISSLPASAASLTANSTMTFELTSNTSLKIFVRGSDGTTRSTTLTLA